jgi:hypothetical protein
VSRRLGALLAGAVLLLAAAPASAAEKLSIPAARERANAFAENTCAHDSSCHSAGVQSCRRQSDRVVLCRIFDHRKTEEQGNFVCTRLIRLGLGPNGRIPVTGVGEWVC